MALYDADEDLMLEGQCPCEFCGELFPFEILIEHQSGCRPDLTSFSNEDYDYTIPRYDCNIIDDIIAPEIEKVKIEIKDANQSKPKSENVRMPSPNPANLKQDESRTTVLGILENIYEPKKTTEKMQTSPGPKLNLMKELKQDKKFQQRHSEQFKDDLSSCQGETLLSFGTNADSTKECDNESQAHKDCEDDVEDIEDINNLSDDDCSETLEEFWKRARDFLKRQRVKNI